MPNSLAPFTSMLPDVPWNLFVKSSVLSKLPYFGSQQPFIVAVAPLSDLVSHTDLSIVLKPRLRIVAEEEIKGFCGPLAWRHEDFSYSCRINELSRSDKLLGGTKDLRLASGQQLFFSSTSIAAVLCPLSLS